MRYWIASFFAVVAIAAQTPNTPEPAFEVTSVKPNKTGAPGGSFVMPPGRFSATNLPLRVLITNAYQLSFFQVVGGPDWVATDRFDVAGTAPDGAPPEQTRAMVRTLLKDRFKLAVHMETREVPIYALVKAQPGEQLGPSLKRSTMDCGPLRAERGLTGEFDFDLQLSAPPTAGSVDAGIPVAPLDDAASIFTALQEQLGLKLESTRGPVELMVIDRAERPSEN